MPKIETCPEEDEDLFHLLHNYTDPRPATFQDAEEVLNMCYARFDVFVLFFLFHSMLIE